MAKNPVVVYGASGYTGRLVCEYLCQFNVPFTAAGSDASELHSVVTRIPGIETAEYDIVESDISYSSLMRLFGGSSVVINTVGPFAALAPDVVQASLDSGMHYIDPSGEQNWLLNAKGNWGKLFAASDLLLGPGIAHMYTTGEIAAGFCLETPGLDSLDILTLWKGVPSAASAKTILTNLREEWFYLEQNQYVKGEALTFFEVVVPGRHEVTLALPWGGTGHPVWFKDDPRVANVRAAGGVFDRRIMEQTLETMRMIQEQVVDVPEEEQASALERVAATMQSRTPPRENPRINQTVDSVYASGPTGQNHCIIRGNCNYKQTALLQAYAAYSLLQQGNRRTGFSSGCQAFGHRELHAILKTFGLVADPIISSATSMR
ncbi:DUF5938 domain-containing protein [Nocardia grenadensis]|uniref:DUF5938 domain-containing protein n=1 Tax=Nocardia grenadensis TaxID=931537 RepID=UPI0009FCB074|nr:DUF5938 domain-containing protein [Nocardia grenadensis]